MTAVRLSASIEGIGVLGPGLSGWPATSAVLGGSVEYRAARTELPVPTLLPAAERRRAGRVVRLAIAVGTEAVGQTARDPRRLASVFSSSGGDGDNCHEICVTLASEERLISPTRFHNSVHNAAAGYWSIAHGCQEASLTVCAYDGSFAAGLLEAVSQVESSGDAVLLIAYDADYPFPLRAHRAIPDAFGLSLLLGPASSAHSQANLQLSLCRQPAARLMDTGLEALRASTPSARGLPLLQSLACRQSGTVVLDYMDDVQLAAEVSS